MRSDVSVEGSGITNEGPDGGGFFSGGMEGDSAGV
jgi:hypothetical protein